VTTNPYESPRVADAAAVGEQRLTLFGATMYVLLTSGGGLLVGGLLGLLVGLAAPDYYRTVFRSLDGPTFNPAIWGLVLGATQGMFAGAGIGLVILLIYVWYLTRSKKVVA
jgi:NhaP-type Na+/H+ or K+/H+ antiporter